LVLGASTKPENMLLKQYVNEKGHSVLSESKCRRVAGELELKLKGIPLSNIVNTITLYLILLH
jgi:hypothetical protein